MEILQQVVPHVGYEGVVGVLIYALWNEIRYRRNGKNGYGTLIKDLDTKLSLLSAQMSGVLVRVDQQEHRLEAMETKNSNFRRDISKEVSDNRNLIGRLEERVRLMREDS